jgi:hypothetical protein
MSYVPSYLVNIERQYDGWPKGISDGEKAELIELVTRALSQSPKTLLLVYDFGRRETIEKEFKRRCPVYYDSALCDFSYACLHRALLAAQAEQVWRLP